MSHWVSGKMDLKCSLAVLKRALLNIMPEWEGYMQTSDNGDLTIRNKHTGQNRHNYHLSVALEAPKIRYADVGFKRNSDGSWSTDIDEKYLDLPKGVKTLQGAVQKEVYIMKAKAKVAALNGTITGITINDEGEVKISAYIPVKEKHRIHA